MCEDGLMTDTFVCMQLMGRNVCLSSLQVPGELLDEAMERMVLTDPHSADCLFRKRCEVPG